MPLAVGHPCTWVLRIRALGRLEVGRFRAWLLDMRTCVPLALFSNIMLENMKQQFLGVQHIYLFFKHSYI